MPLAEQRTMEFACLRCREHVRVALGENERELTENRADPYQAAVTPRGTLRRNRHLGAVIAKEVMAENAQDEDEPTQQGEGPRGAAVCDAVVRCRRCDGLYHAKCLADDGATAEDFECATCLQGDKADDPNDDCLESLPLLVPRAALALMSGMATASEEDEDDDDDEMADWIVLTETVDVCATCRQVHFTPEDCAPCSQCHAAGRVHRRCVAAAEDRLPVPVVSRSPGRKRKRTTGESDPVSGVCTSCQREGTPSPVGAIATRRLALLLQKQEERQWWEECLTCRRDFCLHALVDEEESDVDSLRNRFGVDAGSGFQCRACSTDGAAVEDVVLVASTNAAFYDQSIIPFVETKIGVNQSLLQEEEDGTVLICDGCDGEFAMATLDPPLLEVPDGDWFCSSCLPTNGPDHQQRGEEDALMEILLICDGCESEFDMATLQPPLDAVPDGDWYCDACVAAQATTTNKQDTSETPAVVQEVGADLTAMHTSTAEIDSATVTTKMETVMPMEVDPPAAVTSVEPSDTTDGDASSGATSSGVTLIECDSCDDKFDVTTIRPAGPDVPKGDWFCDNCEAARKRRKKGYAAMKLEKIRRLKAMGLLGGSSGPATPAAPRPVIPRVQMEPRIRLEPRKPATLGLPLPTTVTLLICDGCEGEFDMATLDPPLSSVPRGDWYCAPCANSAASLARRKLITAPCESCKTPVRWNREAQRAARRQGHSIPLCEVCVLSKTTKLKVQPPPTEESAVARDDKKRKRPLDIVQHDGRMQIDPVERIFAPVPVSVSYASGPASTNVPQQATACGHVVCSDEEVEGVSDNDDDHIIIVCEICLSEFNMIDVLGDSQSPSITPPPRPWYCLPCLRRLKKNRKKKQRISKQMMLEMQLYGGLLRPTAAKAVDPLVRALRGKKPSSEEDLLVLSELVGKRVGVMLAWDNHWVMGRVLSFDMASGTHLIRFEDECEQVLPLFAFPYVVGTSEIIEVMVPASRNRWWPAQVMKRNAIAERQLLAMVEDPAILTTLRMVCLFSSGAANASAQESVACWSPRHLCRALPKKAPESNIDGEDEEYCNAVARASNEAVLEGYVRVSAFRALVRTAQDSGDDVVAAIAHALVGCTVVANGRQTFTVKNYDTASGLHRVLSGRGDDDQQLNVLDSRQTVALKGASTLGKLQQVLFKAQRGVIEVGSAEDPQQETEPLDVELIVLPSPTAQFQSLLSTLRDGEEQCNKCGLPPAIDGDAVAGNGLAQAAASLVACVKCTKAFHSYCCDPPHDKFPLISRDDGSVLVDDIKTPFVCQDCVTCACCNATDASQWFRWRLPLQVVSLCDTCVRVYDSKCQCAVCNLAFDNAILDDSPALLKCSSCDLWVHPQCEPDPHPAFRRRLQQDDVLVDFDLDVSIPVPDLTAKQNDQDDDGDDDAPTTGSGRAAAKTARLADEARACELTFKDTYDARVLNNYECLCCRKVRLLRALHRLGQEDKLDLFKEPVTRSIAPTYFDVIKQPMDLATMRQRVLDGGYTRVNFRDFRDDFELLCLNAVTFNSRDRDFLIWREAWRFYGHGQKILRQVAPKTRMKRRGGKHYDALVFAAKRQLPNNASIGKTKTKLGAGSDGDDDDDADDDDDGDDDEDTRDDEVIDVDMRDEANSYEDGKVEKGAHDSTAADNTVVTATTATGEGQSESSGALMKMDFNGVSSVEASVTTSKPAPERKRLNAAAAGISFTPQSELGLAPKPLSALPFYVTMHSRSGAHAYCWVDICGVCGTRGAQDDAMVFCVDCGEGFHTFCGGVDQTKFGLADHSIHTYWRCTNCEMCELCGKPHVKDEDEDDESRWMQCAHCDRGFHGKCLLPVIRSLEDDDSEHSDDIEAVAATRAFYCSRCVSCSSCHKSQPRAGYSFDQELCLSCSQSQQSEQSLMSAKTKDLLQVWTAETRRQRKDAEKCPMCHLRWGTEDADLVQCDACECWAHPQCDPVFVEDPTKYQDLVNDANAQYVCSTCRSHERTHLASTPHLAKCQLFLAKIQRTRSLCAARWVEARAHMQQAQRWNEWKDHLAIYLYVLRIGEECLKHLAYRSVNFQDDWTRRAANPQTPMAKIPAWLVQKAARYLRYKRYARGPRAAARKVTRKNENFYSQQGIDKQKEPHAIATVAAQASSCAALIVCVHLLYGWSPLQRVVFHLLERDASPLDPSLIKSLLVDNNETLEDEIEKIMKQYERRAGKKHLQRLQVEDGEELDGAVDDEISPTGSSISSLGPESKSKAEDADAKSPTPVAHTSKSTGEEVEAPTPVPAPVQVVQPSVPTICMTRAKPLGGVRSVIAGEVSSPTISVLPPTVEDNRYCSLCFIVGDTVACGRLVYVELDQWVHLNCALWSSEVYEDATGVLQRCQKALSRSKTNRCDGCGVLGATLGCCVSRCPRHYHFPCGLDSGVVFLPSGDICCPTPSHVQQVTKQRLFEEPGGGESEDSAGTMAADAVVSEIQVIELAVRTEEKHEGTSIAHDEAPSRESETTGAAAVAVVDAAPPPLQWSPLVKEPRHCVRVDLSSIFADTKKRMNTLHVKRQVGFRVGALTVHSLGHIVIGNPSFYGRDAVYPLGYRSTRVYWSARHVGVRCVYECVVSSTDVESREGRDAKEKPFASPRALFKITASDEKENPIVALSATEALLELRSRVLSLYEDARCFASTEDNPFLNRRSWFSYGLLGHHFFGFGIPEIAQEIESLPHAATTAIRRRYILQRYRHQQNQRKRRRGQEALVVMTADEDQASDHVYVFSHRLPPPSEMALAIREVEQVVEAEEHARLSSGAVRTDGLDRRVDEDEEAAVRAVRRRLNKDATRDSHVQLPLEKAAQPAAAASGTDAGTTDTAAASASGSGAKEKQVGVPMDPEHLPIAMQYRELRRRPFSERLEVLKSKIHGYGLFTKEKFVEGQMIVEYQGQMIAQAVADVREKQYEEMGIGSCYMFRLDEKTIIDATRCGNLARFMNHSCDPKAFARVVVVENNEKKIVIFAKRTIEAFEEVTYDYKFPIEDEAIRCDCGAFNCIGRMN